jgi:hypothetical protein
MRPTPTALPPRILDLPVDGRNLRPWTFGDQLGSDSTLLAFLPDLQDPAARAVVGDLHLARDLWADLAPTIFVHGASGEAGDALFRRLHPGARVVADPGRRLFEALGVGARRRPRFSGLGRLSRRLAEPWAGPAADASEIDLPPVPVLVQLEGESVAWRQPYGVTGDRPELDRILRLARIVARARGEEQAA